ncbi:hypothetical protein BBD42_27080 [Paenibacillus sp. BIHB 4019]|uniref:Exonuclease domain-containing protein n=1 Tax=Paenibacillus sp. BIHB 4019 TaxID=1870819 RepID=A0A1B2DPX7_9BACL|nr:TerD family protein [Paenibacillus sp. BIHB 4019]ANY69748.1 hypothetical protein BBD42_27080 [Paenibacillus sp. BIHB 4019]
MDFVAIDFETANSNRSSACAVGIVEVQGGKIVFEQVWLINPQQHFDRMNIEIHGITPAMVADSPTFSELWPVLEPLLNNKQVVAHNASFDMSVLRYCLDDAALPYPAFHYYCTYQLSKKLLPDMPSYRLNVLAGHYQIPLNHHDALDDARAAALILARLLEQEQQLSPTELVLAKGYKIGKMHARGYTPFSTTAAKSKKQAKPAASASAKRAAASATETAAEKSGLQLIRGQKADITRHLGLDQLIARVSWKLLNPALEIDATAFLLSAARRCERDEDCIFYGNPVSSHHSVSYSKLGPNEAQFKIDFSKLPLQIQRMAFTLSIYEGEAQQHDFSQVAEISIYLLHPQTEQVVAQFGFGEDLLKETAIVIGDLYLHNGNWKFDAIGKGFFSGLQALCENFGLEVSHPSNEAHSL